MTEAVPDHAALLVERHSQVVQAHGTACAARTFDLDLGGLHAAGFHTVSKCGPQHMQQVRIFSGHGDYEKLAGALNLKHGQGEIVLQRLLN